MNLSFTTLGCPEWNLDQILASAQKYGYDAIDFRGYQDSLDITGHPLFSKDAMKTAERIRNHGLSVSCLSSSVRMFTYDDEQRKKYDTELIKYAELCNIFDTKYIRIFGGKLNGFNPEKAYRRAVESLRKMAAVAREYNVQVLLETHDEWMEGELLKNLMKDVDQINEIGILWDVHNPYIQANEPPERTWKLLHEFIKNTHWKDSKIAPQTEDGFEICLMGDGDIPHRRIYRLLKKSGYNGYITFEWEKRWHKDIPGPDIAFPRFAHYMRKLMSENGNSTEGD